jgi:hypothetical protein
MAALASSATAYAQWPTSTDQQSNKQLNIHWVDSESLADGGKLVFVATRIRVTKDVFTITASVTNRSSKRVTIHTPSTVADPPGYVRALSFGIAYREQPSIGSTSTRRLINVRAATFTPQLPEFLDPGATWKGTFTGHSARVREHHDWWIVYGDFDPGGYWVSDKTFST